MRKILLLSFCLLISGALFAQAGKSTFDFLLLPNGVRSSALGGNNVSVIENDISLIYQNPAALGPEMDKGINLNYLAYIADIGMGSATFAKALGERSAWGIGALYTNYGNLKETDKGNNIIGDMRVSDINANLFFSHDLTDKIRGGITAKFIYSNYAHNTAMGLGVDLGLSYYDPEKDFSIGIVGKNIGRQIQSYEEELYSLPWDIQIGFTKRLARAPIRFSITSVYLSDWQLYNLQGEKYSFFNNFLNHLVLGVDFLPSDNLWVALGYNVKRGSDLSLQEGNRLAGFNIGAGLRVKAFSFGFSVGQYHPSATSFMLNVSTFLGGEKL